jgi:hypothetical protein
VRPEPGRPDADPICEAALEVCVADTELIAAAKAFRAAVLAPARDFCEAWGRLIHAVDELSGREAALGRARRTREGAK